MKDKIVGIKNLLTEYSESFIHDGQGNWTFCIRDDGLTTIDSLNTDQQGDDPYTLGYTEGYDAHRLDVKSDQQGVGVVMWITLSERELITKDCKKFKAYADDGIEIPGHIWMKPYHSTPKISEERIDEMVLKIYEEELPDTVEEDGDYWRGDSLQSRIKAGIKAAIKELNKELKEVTGNEIEDTLDKDFDKCPRCHSIYIMKHLYEDKYRTCMSCKYSWKNE